MAQPHCTEIEFDDDTQVHQQDLIVPATLISTAESFQKKGHSWYAISQLPSDLSVKVDDITFYVHKFPLLSRCGYLEQIDLQPSGYELKLQDFPGGPETFEIVTKFCYGVSISLSPKNVAPLRCAAEFLDMTEKLEDGNLISKTESFLTFVVFSSYQDSITVLKSCQTLTPWAENLQIVRRCCDSIAWASQETASEKNKWLNDVSTLRIDHFKRIITSMTLKGVSQDFIGSCIMKYAEKWLLEFDGVKRSTNVKNEMKWSVHHGGSKQEIISEFGKNQDRRTIIESLVSILPHQKEVFSSKFLLWMLKIAMIYSVSPALISELEKRAGMVMENASVYDLLIPGYTNGDKLRSMGEQTLYNVDSVQRILEYYLMNEEQQQAESQGKANISKLLDGYLAEIAGDPNLSATKFQVIAESLPHTARPCDDGLYRAIDIYLKAHPALPEHDRRRLCRVMDCQKLSVDACSHAAQNDRLPIRTVMQVLFAENVKLRGTLMQQKDQASNNDNHPSHVADDNCSSLKEEIKMLKVEHDKMKIIIEELQNNYSNLQKGCERMRKKQNALSGWILGWNKLKKTSFFNEKLDENENTEEKEKQNRISSILRLKTRQSMS